MFSRLGYLSVAFLQGELPSNFGSASVAIIIECFGDVICMFNPVHDLYSPHSTHICN